MNRTPRILLFAGTGLLAVHSPVAAQCDFITSPASPTAVFTTLRAAYDTVRNRVLVLDCSGFNPVRLYAWSGSSWTALSYFGPIPQSDLSPAMTFDSARDRLVVYGGYASQSSPSYPTEVWEWDGAAWIVIQPAAPAFGRIGHAMAYDSALSRVVMFGGTYQGAGANDTWTWDGATWTEVSSVLRPPARSSPKMAYDSARGRMMLWPGAGPGQEPGELWELDGTEWSQRVETPMHSITDMVFDAAASRLILFAGSAWDFDGPSGVFGLRALTSPAMGTPRASYYDAGAGHAAFASRNGLFLWDCDATFSFPWISGQPQGGVYQPGASAALAAGAQGTPPITFRWFKNGVQLANGGNVSGAETPTLHLAPLSFDDTATYFMQASNAGGVVTTNTVGITVRVGCGNANCYPNCDQSTACPILTANDFQCYLNAFAAGNTYANCDGSTNLPFLTANDFQCFLNAFAAGCS